MGNKILSFDKFINESIEAEIIEYIKYPGLEIKKSNIDYNLFIDKKYAGDFRFSGIENYKGTDYVVTEMVDIKDEYKKKGIYSAIIQGAIDWGKATKKADGVISFQFVSDEFKRSVEADAFWESWVKKGRAVKEKYNDGHEETFVYHTI